MLAEPYLDQWAPLLDTNDLLLRARREHREAT